MWGCTNSRWANCDSTRWCVIEASVVLPICMSKNFIFFSLWCCLWVCYVLASNGQSSFSFLVAMMIKLTGEATLDGQAATNVAAYTLCVTNMWQKKKTNIWANFPYTYHMDVCFNLLAKCSSFKHLHPTDKDIQMGATYWRKEWCYRTLELIKKCGRWLSDYLFTLLWHVFGFMM